MGALTARLFYLQIANGSEYAAISTRQRTVLEPIPAPRGLIYDRNGRLLVDNVPTFAVKVRPADLPNTQRDDVVARLAALLGTDASEIHGAIDGNPGSAFDLVRVAQDVDQSTAQLISEAGYQLPGVEVVVEARRQYTDGALTSHLLGYTGPVSAEQLPDLRTKGYQPDDLLGKVGLEAQYETELRGTYGSESVARDATGRRTQTLQTVQDAEPGASLTLTIDTKAQRNAEKALKWAMKKIGMTRGVVIAMNPQTGEILAMVSLPTYDNNRFARGISTTDYAKLLKDKDKPLLNHAIQAHYAPGSTYKLVAGTGALADRKITDSTRVMTRAVSDPRRNEVLRVEPARLGSLQHLLRFRTLERHVLLPDRRHARDRPARLLGEAVRLRGADRRRSSERGRRHRPDQRLEAGRARRRDLPGRDVPGRHRPGL